LEIQFSKFKDLQRARQQQQQKPKNSPNSSFAKNEKLENQHLQQLIYKLNKLEYHLAQCTQNQKNDHHHDNDNNDHELESAAKHFSLRLACLGLFVSLNEDSISPEYYIEQVSQHLDDLQDISPVVVVANSKILQSITKDSLNDFVKANKKNNMHKLRQKVEQLFSHDHNYHDVITHLQELAADTHKLCFHHHHEETTSRECESNRKFTIYSRLLHSFFLVEQFDKCAYLCRRYLRQVIVYLNQQNSSTSSSSTDAAAAATSQKLKELFTFISDLLDLIRKTQAKATISPTNSTSSSTNSNLTNSKHSSDTVTDTARHETVWLVYQLILVFFDSNDFSFKFNTQYRPLKVAKFITITNFDDI
jgi:hypothetical protein